MLERLGIISLNITAYLLMKNKRRVGLYWYISQRRRSVFESGGGGADLKLVFSDTSDSGRAACREALMGGVHGPALEPLVRSRGNAPAGVQGAAPPEAPGF